MREHIRSNVIGYVALFCFAMVGTAGALPGRNTVTSNDIVNGEVKRADVGAAAVNSAKVADDSLTGADVDESTLSVPGGSSPTGPAGGDLTGTYPDPLIGVDAVRTAEVDDNSLTGADITGLTGSDVSNDTLTGNDVDEGTLQLDKFGCQVGKVRGFARVRGSGSIPTTYMRTDAIDRSFNCAGTPPEVHSFESPGVDRGYMVRFPGNPADIAVVSANFENSGSDRSNFASVRRVADGEFHVVIWDVDGSYEDNSWFNIVLY